jgi:dTDP-4-dehydrorhamnose reductase
MKKKILIFGAGGQLGQSLKSVVANTESAIFDFIFLLKQKSDITNVSLLEEIIKKYSPKYIINCAAYTQVDLAEDFKEEAYNINVTGAKNLADLCEKHNCCLLHISTDFVFKGDSTNLLKEDDACNPINYYGLSKLLGEQEIQKVLKEHFIIRTSWLYSEFGNNFVKTMLRLGGEKDSLNVVHNQVGTPTYAVDLAKCIITIIERQSTAYGIYHYSNEGLCSWYDFATTIFEYSGNNIKVTPVASEAFITKAKRPKFSVMCKDKTKATFDIKINYWRESLKICLKKIKNNKL